jgi:hypothetical protein
MRDRASILRRPGGILRDESMTVDEGYDFVALEKRQFGWYAAGNVDNRSGDWIW